ncbi:unnamed protein product [Zymoseptoria tritici ST99CH_3D7]|uniref:Uncharacterized protein n=1 Tax=Zymoseptoria tritici (strain ST99CH_3D7) TaxID=1276538 RepID=A0A1X7RD38_ZYMT9|nr:unnamed protein product [Zymoseptoria tritici ST99CH_3D7]
MDARIEGTAVPQIEAASPLAQPNPSSKQHQQQPELRPNVRSMPGSPSRLPHSAIGVSPSRLRSSSPRHSPGTSEIFERNVQEPVAISNLQGDFDQTHIPAHVITEDSIPPALEASVQAITSESLNPDDVEIVTSSSHQPAAIGIDSSISHNDFAQLHAPPLHHHKSEESESTSLHASGFLPGLDDDTASNYGQLDPNDVRRLSFISFQDVVKSEHHHIASPLGDIGSRESLPIGGVLPPASLSDRAASPLQSPRSPTSINSQSVSGGGITTPPPGVNVTNPLGASAEQSPVRSVAVGSPGSQHGDLHIESMRQALRKTASGDLSGSGGRSANMSPASDEVSSFSRT